MIRNVFGDFQITGKDYAIKIMEELNPNNEEYVFIHDDINRGFSIDRNKIRTDLKIIENNTKTGSLNVEEYSIFSGEVTFGGNVNFFNGNIANTQIYNRALSATEIAQNYNAQKSRFNL